jgi:hypothetical protein
VSVTLVSFLVYCATRINVVKNRSEGPRIFFVFGNYAMSL